MKTAAALLVGSSVTMAILGCGSPSESDKIKAAQAYVSALEKMIDIYQLDVGVYPSTQQGLAALRVAPADLADPTKWRGPYAKKNIPLDPWQNAYMYELLGPKQYKVYSAGPDGQPGTDDDIGIVSG
jgi:general secretion pathway protein G